MAGRVSDAERKQRRDAAQRERERTAAWIRAIREKSGLTQQRFAEALKLPEAGRGMVARWETAVEAPGHKYTRQITALESVLNGSTNGLPSPTAVGGVPMNPFEVALILSYRTLPAERQAEVLVELKREAEHYRSQTVAVPEKG